jgi:ribosomal protein L31E
MEVITPHVNNKVWSKIRSDVKYRVKVELLYEVLRTSILACLR